MDATPAEKAPPEIEQLVLQLARGFHWAGLYGPGHPVLAERIRLLREAAVAQAAREPGGTLLLGIARNKVLYRNAFAGEGQSLLSPLTECLYLLQIATLGIGADVTDKGFLAFLHFLNEARTGETAETPEAFLAREGIAGIRVYPYNYRELLSRKIVEPESGDAGGKEREDAMWRMLLTANIAKREDEERIAAELAEFPELIPPILRRARAAGQPADVSPSAGLDDRGVVTAELLGRMFRRLGATLRTLPEEKRQALLAALAETIPEEGATGDKPESLPLALGESLVEEYSDDEFLDLLATLISVEERAGRRTRRIFEIIAGERNAGGALTHRLSGRARESLRAKNYYALKTWDAVEKMLLSRSEAAYLDKRHTKLLENLSQEDVGAAPGLPAPEPELLAPFVENAMRRKSADILLELLRRAPTDEEFSDLLEEIRKMGPNLVSRLEIDLLDTVLRTLQAMAAGSKPARQAAVMDVISGLDYGQVIDIHLSRSTPPEDRERLAALLVRFGTMAAEPLLERLLNEPEAHRRRSLVALAVRMGSVLLPFALPRLADPRWYFVRNLCVILGEIGDPAAAGPLLETLNHSDPRVRREAIGALGKIRAAEAVQPLSRFLLTETLFSSGKDDPARIDAANALYRIGGAEAIASLHRGTGCRRTAIREHCFELLRNMGRTP